jgi:hypothetical protein
MNTTGAAMTCSVALMRTTIWHELRAPACRGRSAQEKLSMTGKSNDPKEHSREGLHLAECGGGIACGCQRQVSMPAPLPRTTEVVRLPFRDADGEIVAAHVVARKRTAMKDRSWPPVPFRRPPRKRSHSGAGLACDRLLAGDAPTIHCRPGAAGRERPLLGFAVVTLDQPRAF